MKIKILKDDKVIFDGTNIKNNGSTSISMNGTKKIEKNVRLFIDNLSILENIFMELNNFLKEIKIEIMDKSTSEITRSWSINTSDDIYAYIFNDEEDRNKSYIDIKMYFDKKQELITYGYNS